MNIQPITITAEQAYGWVLPQEPDGWEFTGRLVWCDLEPDTMVLSAGIAVESMKCDGIRAELRKKKPTRWVIESDGEPIVLLRTNEVRVASSDDYFEYQDKVWQGASLNKQSILRRVTPTKFTEDGG